MEYEIESTGYILTKDLLKVFKRLGILHPEPHMESLIRAGGASPEDD